MTTSPEQTTPEPPDRHAIVWPARDGADVAVAIWRDDQLAEDLGDRTRPWFAPNTPDEPGTFAEMLEWAQAEGFDPAEAVVLAPAPEMVGDHPRELGGYCRRCGEPHSEPEWQRIADRAAEGGQSGG